MTSIVIYHESHYVRVLDMCGRGRVGVGIRMSLTEMKIKAKHSNMMMTTAV